MNENEYCMSQILPWVRAIMKGEQCHVVGCCKEDYDRLYNVMKQNYGHLQHFDDDYWHCSECESKLLSDEFSENDAYQQIHYCPKCGVKMIYIMGVDLSNETD